MKGDLGIEGELPGAPKKDEAVAAVDKEEGDNEAAAAEESDHSEL
jgi:hypothetical protein